MYNSDQRQAGRWVEWPLCMQAFAVEVLEPMLQELDFEDIEIDLSDSLMEIPEPSRRRGSRG
jgi:hypothetical protein